MKIYTKTGDSGQTSLFSGKRVLKNDLVMEALGTVDECNSAIGTTLSLLPLSPPALEEVKNQLIDVQHALFDLGAALATPATQSTHRKIEKTRFDQESILLLEQWIDAMEASLPKLTAFILPGGHPCGAMLHLARSICRRAERNVISLNPQDISTEVLVYLNRLSDYLFVTSRYINFTLSLPESKWQPHKHQLK